MDLFRLFPLKKVSKSLYQDRVPSQNLMTRSNTSQAVRKFLLEQYSEFSESVNVT